MSAAPARSSTASAPTPAAIALEGFSLRQKPRSLWSDAWRQFLARVRRDCASAPVAELIERRRAAGWIRF